MSTKIEHNEAVKRIAPIHTLTQEQQALVTQILYFCEQSASTAEKRIFIIEGTAGTGKSLVMSSLFTQIQERAKHLQDSQLFGTENYLLVNHPEMLKLYKNMAANTAVLLQKNFTRPTTFINQMRKKEHLADITLVDEAHLLLTKKDRYNHFEQDNQLEEIIKASRIVILVFDPKQVLKGKSYWTPEKLAQLTGQATVKTFKLTTQFRVQAAADVQGWLAAFVQRRIMVMPHKQRFDFRIMDDARKMYQLIQKHERTEGLSRLLATYDYPYRLDGKDYFITAGNLKIRWDRSKPNTKLPWAERRETLAEVGSVYTIQGFDLNYAGIILGPSVRYNQSKDCIALDPARYEDQAAFNGLKQLAASSEQLRQLKEQLMLNALNVLLTRARKGLYLFAADEKLRARLLELSHA
ncbi:DUF2075 domain-containing protein [Liquorilactobacillus satsumensis]|uniref:DUF2075 domain-containing protein n=1 Tax=Liquorilactobacillus satsumensis TaxID=259059 RepID=UPI0021C32980|nr:DUF2075 domain-containing protein [Liquorilactobacillus satsumensis]MCP9313069.1 DUF2075 domain-containing protein [Liquorilactobacillus satsumensis]MCP9360225.1 DUF2075 domain-containing protein [Liquorilactobacillus satsumensis]